MLTLNGKPIECELNELNHNRGLHLAVINPETGKIEFAQIFDTHGTSELFDKFIDSDIKVGHIVVAAVKDDAVGKGEVTSMS